MSKNIFEELPSRKGTAAEARPQPKTGGKDKPGIGASEVEQGADPKAKSEKRIRQAVYDIRYRARREDITLGQALTQYMQNSKLSPQEQAAVKSQLKEEYEVADMIADATTNALYRVFVMNEKTAEEIDPTQEYIEELKSTPERKYHVRVTDKNTGKTYYRYATREKVNQLRANPNIRSVEMLDKMDPTYGKAPYEGERKKGELTARVKAGKGLDPVGREDSDVNNDGKVDKTDKYLLNRRKKIGAAIATRKEDFIWQEETTSTEGKNRKPITGKGVDNYATGVVKVSPEEGNGMKKEEYSSVLGRFHSALQFEAKMSSAEKEKENELKQKYDPSGMKVSMKKKYGPKKGKQVYFATIRKKAMQKAHYEFEDGTLLDEMGMPILGVVKKDDEPKLKKNEGGCEDPREIPTKMNLIKNKFRAMGLKMSYEPEGEQIDEFAGALVKGALAAGGLWAAGKGMEAMKKGVDAKIDRARKTSPIGGDRRVPQTNSYESEKEMVEQRRPYRTTSDGRRVRWDENDSIDDAVSRKLYPPKPGPGKSSPASQAKPAD
jgi:hypothetical protein